MAAPASHLCDFGAIVRTAFSAVTDLTAAVSAFRAFPPAIHFAGQNNRHQLRHEDLPAAHKHSHRLAVALSLDLNLAPFAGPQMAPQLAFVLAKTRLDAG